jgi:hypothetical protein
MEVRDRQVNDIGLVGDHALIQPGKVGRRDGLAAPDRALMMSAWHHDLPANS